MDSDATDSSSSMAGIIHADNDIDFSRVFGKMHILAERYDYHPSLLPVQLFMTHCTLTIEKFNCIFNDFTEVERTLLEMETASKLEKDSKLHLKLRMTIHSCSMGIAELGRRRKFEEELGERLRQDLQNERKLEALVRIFVDMSKNKDSDIVGLPKKIENQREVVSHWRYST
jgi:hypothetical protein